MTSPLDLQPPEPPRMAVRLLTLFTSAEAEESILGDLLEEFSGLAVESGYALARSWYWRQTLKTIAHAGGNAFRAAPWLLLVTVIGGFWSIGFATRYLAHAVQMLLDAHRVYELHPNAYLFWLKLPLEMGRVGVCAGIGACVALAAKRIEMVAVVTLALVQMALFLAATVALIAGGREWLHWFLVMFPWNGLGCLATVVGGVIVRTCRSRAAAGPSAA
jgi:hypothetical protein